MALIAGVAALVLVAIGLVCNLQSVTVAQGASIVWIGAGLAIGGAVIAMSIPRVRTGIQITAIIVAIIAVANGFYVNHQLDHKRQEIQQIISDIPTG